MKNKKFLFLALLLLSCRSKGYIADTTAVNGEETISLALIILENGQPITDNKEEEFALLFRENRYEVRTGFFSEKFYADKIYEKLQHKDTAFYHDQKVYQRVDRITFINSSYTCGDAVKLKTSSPFKCQCTIEVTMTGLHPVKIIERKTYTDMGAANTEADARKLAFDACIMRMRKMFPFDFNPTTITHDVPEK